MSKSSFAPVSTIDTPFTPEEVNQILEIASILLDSRSYRVIQRANGFGFNQIADIHRRINKRLGKNELVFVDLSVPEDIELALWKENQEKWIEAHGYGSKVV